jgi:DNA-binding CsgD family transcriptional regulator
MARGAEDTPTRLVCRISAVIAGRALTVDELLDAASEVICEQIADACVIGILFDEDRKIHPLGLYHRDTDRRHKLESLSELPFEVVKGATGRILEAGRPEVISAAQLELAARSRAWTGTLLTGSEIESALAVPMRAFARKIGILAIARSARRPAFSAEEIPYVQEAGDRLAMAVHALHLAEELERVSVPAPGAEPADERLTALTIREREILALIANGLSSREIAEQLFLSVRTVEWHRARLMVKVGASKRSELVAIGRLVTP